MYKYLLLLFAIPISAFSQTMQRDVIASQGGYFSNSNFDVSWTLGEVVSDTYSANQSIFFSQGFEQPIFKINSDTIIISEPTVYPNPTEGPISFIFPAIDTYNVKCYDIIGQIIFEESITSNFLKLNVSYLSNAYYVFLIVNDTGDYTNRIKILKIN